MPDHTTNAANLPDTVSMQSASSIATLVLHLERRRMEGWEPRAVTYNPDGSVTALLIRVKAATREESDASPMVPTAVPEWPRWMTVPVLARYISLTPAAVRSRLARGEFGGCVTKLGHSLLFDRIEIDRCLERETIGRRPHPVPPAHGARSRR